MNYMNKQTTLDIFKEIGLYEFFRTDDDKNIDWNEYFSLSPKNNGGEFVQVLRITQEVSADGFIHIKVPSNFSAKKVEMIILPFSESKGSQLPKSVREPEEEWDIDYEAVNAALGQTVHTFELLDIECGPEEPSKWR